MDNPYEHQLGYTIKRLHQLMDQRFNEELRPHGLARSQWYALYYLNQADTVTQKDLQEWFNVESATLTGIVNSLERKGWIVRVPSTTDKRAKELRLTPAGKKLWHQLPDPILAINKKMLAGVTPSDIKKVQAVLGKAIENLE